MTKPTSLELPSDHAAKVLGMAQEIADRLTGDAKADADRMLSQAQTTSQQLLAEARAKADGLINEARSRAQTLLDDARTKAETLDRQSREQATALEREAARKHTDTLSAIMEEKNVLEQKIIELRAFEREYRARLKTYLTSQLRELVDPEDDTHAEPQTTVLLRNAG